MTIGLTGGIGAGKSAVAQRLAAHGAVVIDADQLARAVVEPGTPGMAAVVSRFGSGIVGADGSLDRQRLGARVFADPDARRDLESIVHPLVRERIRQLRAAAGSDAVVVVDVPLLVEAGLAGEYDLVIVVWAPTETRIRRLVESRGMSREQALARIEAQASDADRAAVADVTIDNGGTHETLTHAIDEIWPQLVQRVARH